MRKSRPQPPEALVRAIATRLEQQGWLARGGRARYGLAVGLTAALLVALALVGGLSYAASSVHNSVAAAAKVASTSTVLHKSGDHESSADDEYNRCDGDNDGDDDDCGPPKPPKHHKHHEKHEKHKKHKKHHDD